MNRLRKIYEQPIIYILDYSDLKVGEMVDLLHEARRVLLAEDKPCCVISVFNERNFTTPSFMREAEKVASELNHLVKHQSLVGLNNNKKIILQGFNLLLKKDFKSFDSIDDALQYLLQRER